MLGGLSMKYIIVFLQITILIGQFVNIPGRLGVFVLGLLPHDLAVMKEAL